MMEAEAYLPVLKQEIGNIKNGIRKAALIRIPILISIEEDVIAYFREYIESSKINDIALDYIMTDHIVMYLLVYDTKYRPYNKSPVDIFEERWQMDKDGNISEILLYRYYRMLGCSPEVTKQYIDREMNL